MADNPPGAGEYKVSDDAMLKLLNTIQISISMQPNGVVFDSNGPIGQIDEVASYYQAQNNKVYNLMDKNDPNMPAEVRKELAGKASEAILLNNMMRESFVSKDDNLNINLKNEIPKWNNNNSYEFNEMTKIFSRVEETKNKVGAYINSNANPTQKLEAQEQLEQSRKEKQNSLKQLSKEIGKSARFQDQKDNYRTESFLGTKDEVRFMHNANAIITKISRHPEEQGSKVIQERINRIKKTKMGRDCTNLDGELDMQLLEEKVQAFKDAYGTKTRMQALESYSEKGLDFAELSDDEKRGYLRKAFMLAKTNEIEPKKMGMVFLAAISTTDIVQKER